MSPNDGKIKWRKIGAGVFRMKNKIIKPNQTFMARPDEIPETMRDIIIPLDTLPEEKPVEPINPGYSLKGKGAGWYDVVDGRGKAMNEKSLRLEEAKKLLLDIS